jgi:hypothetical protein
MAAIAVAFLEPDLVDAAIDGQFPHGMGVARRASMTSRLNGPRNTRCLASLRDSSHRKPSLSLRGTKSDFNLSSRFSSGAESCLSFECAF